MLYAGIAYHKRYSQVHVIDEQGRTRVTARLANDLPCLRGFSLSWLSRVGQWWKRAGTGG